MRTKYLFPFLTALILITALGCSRGRMVPPPIASPINPSSGAGATGVPEANLTAEPTSIEKGQTVTLKWTSRNAAKATLNQGIGEVDTFGIHRVEPVRDTEYVLEIENSYGETAMARVMVTVRAPAPVDLEGGIASDRRQTRSEFIDDVNSQLRDAYFDYDSYSIRPDAEQALREAAGFLRQYFTEFPAETVIVEGHCDQRGSSEYNLALGDQRASAARDFLVTIGLPAAKLRTVSMGEEMPQCSAATEACYQSNRRAHIKFQP